MKRRAGNSRGPLHEPGVLFPGRKGELGSQVAEEKAPGMEVRIDETRDHEHLAGIDDGGIRMEITKDARLKGEVLNLAGSHENAHPAAVVPRIARRSDTVRVQRRKLEQNG